MAAKNHVVDNVKQFDIVMPLVLMRSVLACLVPCRPPAEIDSSNASEVYY